MITWLTEIYSASHVPNFIRIAPVFIKDITKKRFGFFFLDTVYKRRKLDTKREETVALT